MKPPVFCNVTVIVEVVTPSAATVRGLAATVEHTSSVPQTANAGVCNARSGSCVHASTRPSTTTFAARNEPRCPTRNFSIAVPPSPCKGGVISIKLRNHDSSLIPKDCLHFLSRFLSAILLYFLSITAVERLGFMEWFLLFPCSKYESRSSHRSAFSTRANSAIDRSATPLETIFIVPARDVNTRSLREVLGTFIGSFKSLFDEGRTSR